MATLLPEPDFSIELCAAAVSFYSNDSAHTLRSIAEDLVIGTNNLRNAGPHARSRRAAAVAHVDFYNNELSDSHIPSGLLHDAVLEDISEKVTEQKRKVEATYRPHMSPSLSPSIKCSSTLLSLRHEELQFLAYRCGRYLDRIALSPQRSHLKMKPGDGHDADFSLELDPASPIRQIEFGGSSSWGSSSHLLVRTDNALYHLHTVTATDHVASMQNVSRFDKIVLEPIQRYSSSRRLVDISGMPPNSPSWMHAVALDDGGRLLEWTPTGGLTLSGDGRSIFPEAAVVEVCPDAQSFSIDSVRAAARVSCMRHPQTCFAALHKSVYVYDSRSPAPASILHATRWPVSALRSHWSDPHRVFAAFQGELCLFDMRHTRLPIARRGVPQAHTILGACPLSSFQYDYDNSCSDGIITGAAPFAGQIICHSIEAAGGIHRVRPEDFGHSAHRVSAAVSAFGMAGGACFWGVDGFPVTDFVSSPTACLTGAALMPWAPRIENRKENSRVVDDEQCEQNWGFNQQPNSTCYRDSLKDDYNALLLQQNSFGDIVGQKLRISRRYKIGEGAGGDDEPATKTKLRRGNSVQLGLPVGHVCCNDSLQGPMTLSSATFLPAVGRGDLARFDVLDFDPHCVGCAPNRWSDYADSLEALTRALSLAYQHPREIRIHLGDSDHPDRRMQCVVETFNDHLHALLTESASMSLYELWEFIRDSLFVYADLKVLRQYLRGISMVGEFITSGSVSSSASLAANLSHSSVSMPSIVTEDGLRVRRESLVRCTRRRAAALERALGVFRLGRDSIFTEADMLRKRARDRVPLRTSPTKERVVKRGETSSAASGEPDRSSSSGRSGRTRVFLTTTRLREKTGVTTSALLDELAEACKEDVLRIPDSEGILLPSQQPCVCPVLGVGRGRNSSAHADNIDDYTPCDSQFCVAPHLLCYRIKGYDNDEDVVEPDVLRYWN